MGKGHCIDDELQCFNIDTVLLSASNHVFQLASMLAA